MITNTSSEMQEMIYHQSKEENIYDLHNVQVVIDERKSVFANDICQQY
jgi:formylmethanofuran dehydrogenase subunit E